MEKEVIDNNRYYVQTNMGRIREDKQWLVVTLEHGMELLKRGVYGNSWLRQISTDKIVKLED